MLFPPVFRKDSLAGASFFYPGPCPCARRFSDFREDWDIKRALLYLRIWLSSCRAGRDAAVSGRSRTQRLFLSAVAFLVAGFQGRGLP